MTKAQVWTIEFDGHPPVPLKDNEIDMVGWLPPDMGRFPFEFSGPAVVSHYEFKLSRSPVPSVDVDLRYLATLHGPDGRTEPGVAYVVDIRGVGPKATYKVHFLPTRTADV